MCMMHTETGQEDHDVRALRTARGWTQDQMADYLGVDRSTVSRLENGAEQSGPVRRLLALLNQQLPAAGEVGDAI